MLSKTITYTDYNGVERTETFYFNLSESELTRWAMSVEGGLHARLQRIIDAKDNVAVMKEFDNIIAKSYGVKSDDGRRFEKSKKITEEFMQTPAYDQLYMDLITGGTDVMSAFINGIVPMDLVKEADAEHKAALSVVNPV